MIDLDDFKIYNDTFGHDAGDLALTTVVGIVKANVRRTDMLIRMGGDEFLLVMPDITDQIFADKLKQIQEKVHDTKVPGILTASSVGEYRRCAFRSGKYCGECNP